MTQLLPERQAFIGVGTMGSLMAGCLLDAGVDLAVYDIRREAAEPLLDRGARWADSAEQAVADCQIVWTSLPGPTQVESVLLGDEAGVLSAMSRRRGAGGHHHQRSRCRPPGVHRLRGTRPDHAGRSGQRPSAHDDHDGRRRCCCVRKRPDHAGCTVAAQVFYVGPAGAGCVAKMATQYMGYTNLIAAIEGMLIARLGGVDPAVLAEIVPVSAGASRAFNAIPNSILNRTFQAGGTLDIVAKDVALACALAERLQAPAGTGSVADALYKQAQAEGWGDEGYPIVARILETLAGVELQRE